MDYDATEYFRLYILEHLRTVKLNTNTELVHLLRDGQRRVTKKDLIAKYGSGKSTILRETLRHPAALDHYRRDKRLVYQPPLDHEELAVAEGTPIPDWDSLLTGIRSIPGGHDRSGDYETAVEALLSALFYPSLAYPQLQRRMHDGRKRIDITYTNLATAGFFSWIAHHYSAPHVFVECKNYSGEVGNPELDQLAGRFSPSRGQVGLLVCRRFDNKELFLRRCRDTANDQRGYVVALDDDDLEVLVATRRDLPGLPEYHLLRERFERLVL